MLCADGKGAGAGFTLCMGSYTLVFLDCSPGQFCQNPTRAPELRESLEGGLAWDFIVAH